MFQDVRLRDEGAAGPGVRPVPRGPGAHVHQRPFHGRPRGHGGPSQESGQICQRLRQPPPSALSKYCRTYTKSTREFDQYLKT